MNNSIGLIDVAYRDPLHCLWTIGNVGITNAVTVFIIQRIIISSCRYLDKTELFFFWGGGVAFLNYEREPAYEEYHNLCAQAILNGHLALFFHQKTCSRPKGMQPTGN